MKAAAAFLALLLLLSACEQPAEEVKSEEPPVSETTEQASLAPIEDLHEIYFAGGCFWGVEAFFERLPGVTDAVSGYANGEGEPSYRNIMRTETGYAETVRVSYNRNAISLPALVSAYLRIVDPFSLNRQGNDAGTQYRTGIYSENPKDLETARAILAQAQTAHDRPFVIETEPLAVFYEAEDEHQDYLTNNPAGYCHIDLGLAEENLYPGEWDTPEDAELKEMLSPLQYEVTREKGTERAFDNEYYDETAKGIYVDITSGQPLFRSDDKFVSQSGWPSFTRAITPDAILLETDSSLGMRRVEVLAKESGSHLGHVFPDGPRDEGGLRFCMNSAALRFIPVEDMEEAGYGVLIPWLEQ